MHPYADGGDDRDGDEGEQDQRSGDDDGRERPLAAGLCPLRHGILPHEEEDEPYHGEKEAEHRKAAAGRVVGIDVPLLRGRSLPLLLLGAAAIRAKARVFFDLFSAISAIHTFLLASGVCYALVTYIVSQIGENVKEDEKFPSAFDACTLY